jgi:hypothetical protein
VLNKPRSIAVSVAGSLAQIALLGIPARIAWQSDWGSQIGADWAAGGIGDWELSWWPVLYWLSFASLWWGVINLLPIRPLDGGHVAETLVGFETACKLSIGFAAVAAVYFIAAWDSFFGAIWMALFAFMNYRDLQAGRNENFDVDAPEAPPGARGRGVATRRGGRRRTGHLRPVPSSGELAAELSSPRDAAEIEARAWNALRGGDADRAAAVLRQAGPGFPGGFVQASVALAQGHSALAVDLFEAAYLADPTGPPNLVAATLLAEYEAAVPLARSLVAAGPTGVEAAGSLQTHLHYAERFHTAAEVGEQVFAARPTSPAQTAFEVACSWARAGQADEALRWVEAAVDAGFKAPSLLDSEPDLASVRELPGWTAVRSRLSA